MLREFKGCIKYALLQIQIRGENPNTPIAESVSPPEPLKYMKCIVSLCSGYFESIEKHFLQYTLCKSNVGMYSTIGWGGGVLKGSNMLISPAHAFCLDYAQQAQVVDPSIGPSHPLWKWYMKWNENQIYLIHQNSSLTRTSGRPFNWSHRASIRKWFQGSSSLLLLHKPNSHISLSPPSRPALNIVKISVWKISIFCWGNVGLRADIMQMVPT